MDKQIVKKDVPRDKFGDLQFPSNHTPEQINDYIRRWEHTYIFKYFNEERQHYWPYFDLFDDLDRKLEEAKKQNNCAEIHLFETPDKPTEEQFSKHNWQLHLFVNHFKEVFNINGYQDGTIPNFKFWRIILPKNIYSATSDFIIEYKLERIHDLIFEIIASAQKIYVDEVSFWETPENQQLISSIDKEVAKVIDLIERTTNENWMRDPNTKQPAELSHINFVFKVDKESVKQDVSSIKIKHPWLALEFIEHFKSHYNENYPYKNWKIELERYSGRFEDDIRKQQFKYQLTSSLYNMLTEAGFFDIKKNPTPNPLMLCIARLLEFCLIPVKEFSDSDSVKIKHVRNWIDRNLEQVNSNKIGTEAIIPPNKEKLLKYFDSEFINCTGDAKPLYAMGTAYFLCKRFNMQHLLNDMIHIVHCLRERRSQYGMSNPLKFHNAKPTIPDIKSLSKLYNTIQNRGKVTQLKFKVQGDENEYELSEPVSMYLINRAFGEALYNHQEEYEVDIVKGTFETCPDCHSFNIKFDTRLNQPEERFAPKFVKSFYAFLLNEAPPGKFEYNKSEDYYMLIALAMQECWYFNHQMSDEKVIQHKVKHWHQLATHPPK